MGAKQSLLDTRMNLKLQSREAQRLYKKCLKDEEDEKLRVKSALESNNTDSARLHAANSLRKKSEALKYLQFQARLDVLTTKVESAMRSQSVTDELKKALPLLNKCLKAKGMDTARVYKEFDKVFEDLEVKESYVEETMRHNVSNMAPASEVDLFISKVAEEHDLDAEDMLHTTGKVESLSLSQKKQKALC